MSQDIRVDGRSANASEPISFAVRLAASDRFDSLFKDGMALVERTATYLDGEGRREAKGLSPATTVIYATESMRLTTRLLDLASWLLIRRALKQGEISEDEARMKRQSVKLQRLGRPAHVRGFEELPAALRDLVEQSFALLDRVVELDRVLTAEQPDVMSEPANPVGAQILELHRAFGQKAS